MVEHVASMLVKAAFFFLIGIPVKLLGLVMVAVAIPFRITDESTSRDFTQFPGEWKLVRLPGWARFWDNAFDGLWGDKRGWWDNHCRESIGKPCTHPVSMWLWAAIRNPANYWGRNITGIDVTDCVIEKLAGQDTVIEDPGCRGWTFLMATDSKGRRYHRFFCIYAWSSCPERGLCIDIGWKISLTHRTVTKDAPPQNRIKGTVCLVSPWKSL